MYQSVCLLSIYMWVLSVYLCACLRLWGWGESRLTAWTWRWEPSSSWSGSAPCRTPPSAAAAVGSTRWAPAERSGSCSWSSPASPLSRASLYRSQTRSRICPTPGAGGGGGGDWWSDHQSAKKTTLVPFGFLRDNPRHCNAVIIPGNVPLYKQPLWNSTSGYCQLKQCQLSNLGRKTKQIFRYVTVFVNK